jgi:outer membrane protein
MIKKIIVLMLIALPLNLIAQEKLAYVNVQEIFQVMPELSDVEKKIADFNEQYRKEMEKMYEEYYAKTKEYQENSATLAETIKVRRQSEIVDLEKRIATFQQQASDELQQKQIEMIKALRDKIMKATSEVGAENNYTYIFDISAQTIVYHSPKAVDVTPLVRKKMGIK